MEILLFYQQQRQYSFSELLSLTGYDNLFLNKQLEALVKKKRLKRKKDIYILGDSFFVGKLDLKENFGFLLLAEGDLYLENKDLKNALHGDTVLVRKGPYNKVLEILKRAIHQVVCEVKKTKTRAILIPKKPIRFPLELIADEALLDKEVILVKLDTYYDTVIGVTLEKRLGFKTDPGIDILALVYEFGFPYGFSEKTLKEANSLEKEILDDNRGVIEDEYIITIDGADAKDLDDAVSLKWDENFFYLSVHIADVSHYVVEDSFIDQEAFIKGTSCYLADRVIPMLPRRLSNDLCSLNEGEKRYALSVFMTIDLTGEVISHEIKQTVIKVDKKLTYQEVNKYLKHDKVADKKLLAMLKQMAKLADILKRKRRKKGALEFVGTEYKFIFDKDEKVKDIVLRKMGVSEGIIESFMIVTNETVSQHLSFLSLPCIYRVHEKPEEAKLTETFAFLENLNVKVPKHKNISAKSIQKIIESQNESPLKLIVHELLLKAMNKAKYSQINLHHFGLASRFYSHFTAPIRRYPDLVLHRLVKAFIISPDNLLASISYYEGKLEEIAIQASKTERLAIDLEREVDKLMIATYMKDKIGQRYDCVVSGFIKTGMFVRLSKGFEGMVPFWLLENSYYYDERNKTLVSKTGKQIYKLTSPLKVELIDVKMESRQLTFKIVN